MTTPSQISGQVSIVELAVAQNGDEISLNWEPVDEMGNARVWLSYSNAFADGKEDEYELMGEVPVSEGNFSFAIKDKAEFYKLVVEAPHNNLNRWIIPVEAGQ